MTNTPSPTSTKERAWVWFSTDESIAKGQISIVACAEIPVAMAFFWWISQISPWPWLTLIALMAAPMLLLRSDDSIELGLKWLRGYWEQKELTKRQQWVVVMLAFVIASALSRYLEQIGLITSWWLVALLGSVVVAFAFAFAGAFAFAFAGAGAGAVAEPVALMVAVAVVVALMVAFEFAGEVVVLSVFVGQVVGQVAIAVAGIFIRTTLIRLFATLRRLPAGITNFSSNWRETVLVIDLAHPPMLLPRANEVVDNLSLATWWKKEKEDVADWVTFLIFTLIIYFPALLYRWNIKASSMIWGLLAFVLRPVVWEGDEKMRAKTVPWTTWVLQSLIASGVLFVFGWLLLPYLPADINQLFPKSLQAIGEHLPPPPFGLRYVFLMGLSGCFTFLLLLAYQTRSCYSELLDKQIDPSKGSAEQIAGVTKKITLIHHALRFTFALAVLTVWSYALAYGLQKWPEVTQGLVWGWLRGWV